MVDKIFESNREKNVTNTVSLKCGSTQEQQGVSSCEYFKVKVMVVVPTHELPNKFIANFP